MWNGPVIELTDWSNFSRELKSELEKLSHTSKVLFRAFELVTVDIDKDYNMLGETDRLNIVFSSGVDRDNSSSMWNAPGHDYEHDQNPTGKRADEIIYAYIIDPQSTPYTIHNESFPDEFDLTNELGADNGVLIYDASKLKKVAKNEHWFVSKPKDALLLVFKLSESE